MEKEAQFYKLKGSHRYLRKSGKCKHESVEGEVQPGGWRPAGKQRGCRQAALGTVGRMGVAQTEARAHRGLPPREQLQL